MSDKRYSHEPIYKWSSLHELSEIKKDYHKAYMVTYQIFYWIKEGVLLGERSVTSGPMHFFKTDQIVPSILVSSQWKSVYNNFLIISFWKQINRIHAKTILFCVYIVVLQSSDLVVCVALELRVRFLQTLIFFWKFLKGIVHQLLKWGALKCNHVAIWNSCAYIFFSFCRTS